jgi:hypothetical protein
MATKYHEKRTVNGAIAGFLSARYVIYEAKTKLPNLIKQVQQGERVTITNRGEPVADRCGPEIVSKIDLKPACLR